MPTLLRYPARQNATRIAWNYIRVHTLTRLERWNSKRFSKSIGLGINAGHDLNTKNLPAYVKSVRALLEVSIGHALFCDAIYLGLKRTVGLYLKAIGSPPGIKGKPAAARRR